MIHAGHIAKGNSCWAGLGLKLDITTPQRIGGIYAHSEAGEIVGKPPRLHRHMAAIAAKLPRQDLPPTAVGVEVDRAAITAMDRCTDDKARETIAVHVSGGADRVSKAVTIDLSEDPEIRGRVGAICATKVDVDLALTTLLG